MLSVGLSYSVTILPPSEMSVCKSYSHTVRDVVEDVDPGSGILANPARGRALYFMVFPTCVLHDWMN